MDKLKASRRLNDLPLGLFVSVDPQRDTPDRLAEYVAYFDPDFMGVTGDPEQLRTLTRQLGILYLKTPGDNEEDYLIDHSAGIILFDPQGKFHALFNVPHDADKIAGDFLKIRDYYEATR
jgi:protein SCO1/2